VDETTAKLHRFGEILNTLLWGFFTRKESKSWKKWQKILF